MCQRYELATVDPGRYQARAAAKGAKRFVDSR